MRCESVASTVGAKMIPKKKNLGRKKDCNLLARGTGEKICLDPVITLVIVSGRLFVDVSVLR